ncbi:M28 family peptidase, partial [candidate division KSB1 bacterium]|nr:M28 family peptidase [candidate division KSB1 bacterium]
MKNSGKVCILFNVILAIAVSVLVLNNDAFAQTLHIEKKIPTVEEIVSKVSLDEVVRMHDKLVSFGNRNTFSDTVSSTWGMGAARRWIYSEFMKMSEASGGRLQVYYDKFELDMPTNFRNDDEVEKNFKEVWGDAEKLEVSNVVAVLPGRTDDIRFIVNGHMDSRARHSYDITTLAPGAVDDASGTIVMMELARVLSQYEFDHTLVFSADTGEEQEESLFINDHPHIFEAWMHYVENNWKPWAEEDRELQAIQKVYNDLYAIYQKAEKLGEQYEVVVGLGHLLWRSPHRGDISHPLLTLKARVSFDPMRGIMSVSPALGGSEPQLEIDMLEPEDRPGVRDQQAIQEMVGELDGELWDGTELEAILKSLANGVSTESRYDRAISRPAQISDVPQRYCAPSLILRKRTWR